MSQPALVTEDLSKQYRIGLLQQAGRTLREAITDAAAAPLHRLRRREAAEPGASTIWALRNISLAIQPGEVVGIIGRNGAGKSTLLRILSRITEPTAGRVEIRGRVASLLEVGTGFHPELTGRENIQLNAAILGMTRREIARKFDEIVAFAEVEQFIDTPVKRYSSGMYLRLAFAVAAYLEPEILIVDEVLAVGDASFQKKCLGRMGDVARQGRTVLFVSHNLPALSNLCQRAVLLVDGMKRADGPSDRVIGEYIGHGADSEGQQVWNDPASAPGTERIRLHSVRVISRGQCTANVDIQEDIRIELDFWNFDSKARICSSIHLLDKMGMGVLASANMHSANLIHDDWFDRPHPVGLFRTTCTIPGNFLNEGRYSINAIILTDVSKIELFSREAISFTVHDSGTMRKEYFGHWLGVVRPKLAWQTHYLGPTDPV
jgi:lipopolysaccharide transport system ATP-binding protein